MTVDAPFEPVVQDVHETTSTTEDEEGREALAGTRTEPCWPLEPRLERIETSGDLEMMISCSVWPAMEDCLKVEGGEGTG